MLGSALIAVLLAVAAVRVCNRIFCGNDSVRCVYRHCELFNTFISGTVKVFNSPRNGCSRSVREHVERKLAGKTQKRILAAVDTFHVQRSHVVQLLDGAFDQLLRDVLGSLAAQALDQVLPGLQAKVEKGTAVAIRVENAAKQTEAASSLAADAFRQLVNAGTGIPMVGELLKLFQSCYGLAKGAHHVKEELIIFIAFMKVRLKPFVSAR